MKLLSHILILLLLLTSCKRNTVYSINNHHKALSKYDYIYKAAKGLNLMSSGIIVLRDTNKLIHNLPGTAGFNKDGKIIPSATCYATLAGYITFLHGIKEKPPLTDTPYNIHTYFEQSNLKFLDGKKFTLKDLPPADYYVFIEWAAGINNVLGKSTFEQINKEMTKTKNNNKVVIIYVHAFDFKRMAQKK